MAEYSFDVACKVDEQELANAIDQTLKEVNNRFDFKGVDLSIKKEKDTIAMESSSELHMKQLIDVLQSKMVKRDLNLKAFNFGEQVPRELTFFAKIKDCLLARYTD